MYVSHYYKAKSYSNLKKKSLLMKIAGPVKQVICCAAGISAILMQSSGSMLNTTNVCMRHEMHKKKWECIAGTRKPEQTSQVTLSA